jgi:uncharacterized repeat protein (TIGR01451 family)
MTSFLRGLAAVSVLSVTWQVATAQTPDAGTNIVNQATVLYTDETGAAREATTNEVILFVQAVYSATLDGDRARPAAISGQVSFVHALTNTGNASNTFCVSATERTDDSGDFDRVDVIYDASGDGIAGPDEQVIYSSSNGLAGELELVRGQTGGLIAVGQVPAGAVAGETYALDLAVTSKDGTASCGIGTPEDIGANADGVDGTNRDIATISADAILEITKASTYNAGVANTLSDDQISYTITVRNIGSIDATDLTVSDTLPTEVAFDAFGTNDGIYSTAPAHLSGVVSAQAATLAVNDELIIRFSVDVDPTLGFAGEDLKIENFATVEANLDGVAGLELIVQSNTVIDKAAVAYGVILSDIGGAASPAINDGADDDGTVNDVQSVDTAAVGETVEFTLTVTNTGNVTDTYNLVENGRAGWFSGAGLRYLNADNVTPLLDTNGDGIPDTGPVEPGETVTVRLKAVMPFTEPTAAHTLGLQAVSTADVSGGGVRVSDPASLAIGASLAAGVDIANTAGASGLNDGGSVNADPDTAITTTLNTAPGGTVTFDLFIANEGSGPDTYGLSAAANASGTVPLPNGWSVIFEAVDGTPITATPSMAAGSVYAFRAKVKAAPSASDGASQSIFFAVASFDTGVSDVKQDAMTVSAAPSITLTPDQFGQVAACGREEHLHTLRNSGGTNESVKLTVTSQSALTSELRLPTTVTAGGPAVYADVALLNVGDTVAIISGGVWTVTLLVSDGAGGLAIPLQSGDETRVIIRIIAACDAASGTVDVLVLEAETLDMDASSRIIDTTTVASARLDVSKLGALDAGCAGGADAPFEDARVQAEPGDCVIWQITLVNAGTEPVCDVRARDAAPSFTQFQGVPLITQQPNPGTGSCNVNGNEFACTLGNSIDVDGDTIAEAFCLRGGEQAQVAFSVEIQ